ncbi:hypothetical protein SUGI_0497340 [Cryptomeria japonica]|nr:hypothetical protein SUGI_0497340 [Cryptomeria japonica]
MLDTRATRNFIDEGFVARCRLQTKDFDGFRVRVVHGYALMCTRWIGNLTLQLNDYELHVDFYVVNMGVVDIVLGMKWLQDIREFTLNIRKLEMKFELNSKSYVLRGIADGNLHSIYLCREESKKIEHEIIQEEFTFAHDSRGTAWYDLDQYGSVVQFVKNPLFEIDATWSCDNPLFEIDVDHSHDPSP